MRPEATRHRNRAETWQPWRPEHSFPGIAALLLLYLTASTFHLDVQAHRTQWKGYSTQSGCQGGLHATDSTFKFPACCVFSASGTPLAFTANSAAVSGFDLHLALAGGAAPKEDSAEAKKAQEQGDSLAAMEAYTRLAAEKEKARPQDEAERREGLLNETSFDRRRQIAVYRKDGKKGHHMQVGLNLASHGRLLLYKTSLGQINTVSCIASFCCKISLQIYCAIRLRHGLEHSAKRGWQLHSRQVKVVPAHTAARDTSRAVQGLACETSRGVIRAPSGLKQPMLGVMTVQVFKVANYAHVWPQDQSPSCALCRTSFRQRRWRGCWDRATVRRPRRRPLRWRSSSASRRTMLDTACCRPWAGRRVRAWALVARVSPGLSRLPPPQKRLMRRAVWVLL